MGLKSILSQPLAKFINSQNNKWSARPGETQENTFNNLISRASKTKFGRDHGFDSIKNYEDYKRQVPIRDYENIKKYIAKKRKTGIVIRYLEVLKFSANSISFHVPILILSRPPFLELTLSSG